ncbi:hypothetical protein LRR81_03975 [Metabacillus sp. GX 13764]|uniref:hypothetical protein n=1 Tax=Metabacillus kandeliae TaxID=2900151 RepID=UPI001E2CFDED|nr:hypothetical protein [Metabacillus kandeliae]MCD7033377.1 hypothetical protein [Metabacillus kandeliae]
MTRVSPEKGEIRTGAYADYNLYKLRVTGDLVETGSVLDYDITVPAITVHKGRVVKAGKEIMYTPGFGEERLIPISKFAFNERSGRGF